MRAARVVVSVVLLVALAACASAPAYRARFRVAMSEVERTPPHAGDPVWPAGGLPRLGFQDEWLEVRWALERKELGAELRNLSGAPFTIRWDRARFVSADGEEHELVDRWVAITDRVRPKPSSTLAAGATASESLYPADFLHWEEGDYPDYAFREVLPQVEGLTAATREEAAAFAEEHKGKTVQLRLPIEGPDAAWEYRFTFALIGAWAEKLPWS